jgi:hypothetical protein
MSTETCLSCEEFQAAAGISAARFERLVQLGLVDPTELTPVCVARVCRVIRLHRDLGVNYTGAAVIVDLVERLDRLEAELASLRRGPGSITLDERSVTWISTE